MPRPPIPFDAERWKGSVRRSALSMEHQGVYFNLLVECWLQPECALPGVHKAIEEIVGCPLTGLEIIIPTFFVEHPELPGKITNERLYADFLSRMSKSAARAKAAAKRWSDPAQRIIGSRAEGERYQGPDRNGNPRKQMEQYPLIWLSEPEYLKVREDFRDSGLRKEFHRAAFEKLQNWFEENSYKHKTSSEHKTRLTTWALTEALRLQAEADRAARQTGLFTRNEPKHAHPPLFKKEQKKSS